MVVVVGGDGEVGDEDVGVVVEGAAFDVVDVVVFVAVVADGGVGVGGVGAAAGAPLDRVAILVFEEFSVVDAGDLAI